MEATSTAGESRVAELLKVNAALKATLDSFSNGTDIYAVLGESLRAIAVQLAGPGSEGSLWLTEQEGHYVRVHLVLQDGVILSPEEARHPSAGILTPFGQDEDTYRQFYVQGQPLTMTIDRMTQAEAEYLRSRGYRAILSIPMLLAGQPVGIYILRIPEGVPDPSPERMELALALAQQATFALQMTRLAEAAELAAIERERAAAAEARAAKLAVANRLLRESAEKLGNIHDIDDYLGQVLLTITELLGGHSSTIWTADHERGESTLRYVVQEGRAIPGAFSDHPNAKTPFKFPPGADLIMPGHGTGKAQPYQRRIEDNPGFDERTRAHFAALAVTSLVSIPIVLNNLHFGTFTIRLKEDQPLLDDDRELIQALAGQSAVALHLTQVAAKAREAAVSHEKEEAANRRAEVLARANQAVRSSLDRLAERQDLTSFFGDVVVVCARELDAVGAGIWINDEEGYNTLVVSFEDNEVRHAGKILNPGARDRFKPPATLKRGVILVHSESQIAEMDPRFAGYLKARNISAISSVPMFIGERWVGTIVLRYAQWPDYTQEKRELAHALANQVALALELTRLADEAQQAAIAREREEAANRRAEVLARANGAIRASLDRLAERQDLNAFLGEAIVVCARELNAVGAGIWVREQGLHSLIVSLEDGEVRFVDRIKHPGVQQSSDDDVQELSRGGITIQDEADIRSRPWYPKFREYLEARGIVSIASVPLFIGERWAGTIVLRYTETPDFPAEQRELAHTLANQVALALELTRLAEEAQQAAVVHEREKSARERADELARMNQIIRSTVEVMTSIPALDEFLGAVMAAINENLGARGSTLWILDYEALKGRLAMCVVSGRWSRTPPVYEGSTLLTEFPFQDSTVPYFANMKPRFTPNIQDHPNVDVGTRKWFRMLEVAGLQELPIAVGGNAIAVMSIHCQENEPFPSDKLELAIVLSQQAGLAIHLTHLAEEAQKTAIAIEKQQAAQQQSAQLARANQALSYNLTKLASHIDVEGFLGEVLLTICHQLDEADGGVWLYDFARERLTLRISLEDGNLIRGEWPEARWIIPRNSGDHTATLERQRLRNMIAVYSMQDVGSLPEWQPYREILRIQGFRCLMEIPMYVGEEIIGFYAIRARQHESFERLEIELSQALANQAALACHMARLGEAATHAAQTAAIAEERNRLAREIHDTLAQGLAAIAMQLQGATRERASLPRAIRPYLETAFEIARESLAEARRSVNTLRSPGSTKGGFAASVARIVEQAQRTSVAKIDLRIDSKAFSLPRNVEDESLRVLQESLTNSAKHSRASEILVELFSAEQGGIRLKVKDNGAGFDADQPTAGFGLAIMQERAEGIGATLTLITEPGEGTEVVLVWTANE